MKKLLFLLLALTVSAPAFAQTQTQYYTVPTIAALKAMTTSRPAVVQVVDANPGIFNLSTGACAAADDIFQVQPTAGTTVCYTRAATPYAVGASGLALATGGLVDPRVAGAVCDGASNSTSAIQSTITAADASRKIVMLPPGNCLLNSGTGLTGVDPIVMRGMGAGSGPGAVDNAAGTLVLPNFLGGNVVSLTSNYSFNLSDMQFNSNAGLRTSGAGLRIAAPNTTTTNGFSLLSNLSFNQQYDGIHLYSPGLPIVEKTYHQAWKNTAITCEASASAEPTCGNYLNNYLFGESTAGTTQIAGLNMNGGYTKVLANHLLGAQAGLLYDIGLYPAGSPNAFFNTFENNVHYGIRAKNSALQSAGQVSWIGNEFLTEGSTSGPTLKAFMQIDANSTPGSTWVTNAQILGNNMRGQLTGTSGPAAGGLPAYVSIDGTKHWQLIDTAVSAMSGDTAVGVYIGPDSRNGLISNFSMLSETGAAVTKYSGTMTYTQIYDMQGMTYAQTNAIAPANGSMIYVTDGQVGSTQQLTSGGSGVWAFRHNGIWEPLGRTQGVTPPEKGGTGVANNALATLTRSGNHALTFTTTATTAVTLPTSGTLAALGGTNAWTAVNTFKSTASGSNVTLWYASNNNGLARIYDDGASGLFSVYNAAASERVRMYAGGQSYIEDTFRLGGALTYGGITLSNSVTGTGNMVLSAAPTFTGTGITVLPTGVSYNILLGSWGVSADYGFLSFSGSLSAASGVGIGGKGPADNNLYLAVPTGGKFRYYINGGAAGTDIDATGVLSPTVHASSSFVANGSAGLSATTTVRDAAGTGTCTLIFTYGIKTGGSC